MRGFSERTGKPVVVSSASVNASAAYEISSQADYIYTAKTTAIGAIGTVMQVTDLSGLMEKLGISVDNVTSADSKDSSYGTRPLTEEERAQDAFVDAMDEMDGYASLFDRLPSYRPTPRAKELLEACMGTASFDAVVNAGKEASHA